MSKEEILKIQKCVLKVNIHCDGCKQKVKKILQKIDGVFTTEIDADQGKVTVSGNVDPNVLIKKLAKSGKHAELWGAPKPNNTNNNQNNLVNQIKNMHIENGKGGGGGGNNKGGQNQKFGGGGNNQQKGGQQHGGPTPQQQQQQQQQLLQQQLQQLQQMKGMQDLKLPHFKDLKLPTQNPNQKAVKFNVPEDDDLSDDEYDDEFDDEDYDDDFEDEMDDLPPLKMGKQPPMQMGNGAAAQMMLNGNHPQLMNAHKGGNPGGNAGANGKKAGGGGGGGAAVPIQMMGGGNEGKNGNGGKKGGGGNNQNQAGGNKNNGGKNGGGMPDGKNGQNGGGNKNISNGHGGGGNGNNGNGGKKVSGMDGMHAMIQNMGGHNPHASMAAANMGPVGNMSMPMGNMPMGQMNNIPAVQGLPATSMNGSVGGGYFQGAGPDVIPGNPYHHQQQQQYMAAMMNQQRAMGNDRFQPMMYARPPPDVNYLPPSYGYHPYPPPDPYSNFFSDENTSSCSIM